MSDRQAKRALPTNSAKWRRIRAMVLAEQPLCVHCEKRGRLTPALHVDHIDNDSHNNKRSNLQGLCAECHSRKTATEMGYNVTQAIGLDGWPVE